MEDNRNYLREQILEAQGKNIGMDFFLYSCLEHERMRRATLKDGDENEGRWPILFDAKLSNLPKTLSEKDLNSLIKQMCLWYASQYPELVEDIPLDHEQLSTILDPFVKLTLDIADLVFLKTEKSLPMTTSSEPEAQAIWTAIRSSIRNEFAPYEEYFTRFLDWTFGENVEEVAELGSRPPVGKFAPSFKQRQSMSGGGDRGPRNDRSGGDRGGRNNNNRNFGGNDNRGGGDRPRVERGPRHDNRPPRNQPQHNDQRTAQLEQEALAAVDEAIAQLNGSDTEEVFLKPVNSFYRRIQHQYAVDKGFNSCSVGEGNERGVKVSKKLSE